MSNTYPEFAGSRCTLRNLLAGASALVFGTITTTPVLAQAQPEAEQPAGQTANASSDEIVVTGLRASLATAQAIKMNADQFVDSITAVDIGKLPDTNVAEALQRISGIQITRNRGEGSGIAIRGLTEVRTEINGRDAFGGSGGRALGFEDVPSELLAGVDVYKNPSAELVEGGIGGLVNLRTRMPFDQKDMLLSASVGLNNYDLIDKTKPNYSILASKRWDTSIGEVGVLVNYSYFEGAYRSDESTIEPYFNFDNVPGSTVPATVGSNRLIPDGAGIGVSRGERKRRGLYATLQWAPASNVEFYTQFFQSRYYMDDDRVSSFITCYSDNGTNPNGYSNEACLQGLTPSGSFVFDDDGNFVSGGFSGFTGLANNSQVITNRSKTTDISGGVKWNVNDRLKLSADVQYVKSTYENGNFSVFGQQDGNLSAYYDVSGRYPKIRFGPDPDVYDPSRYYLVALMDHIEDSDADQIAARADLEWSFDEGGFLESIAAGVRLTDRSANNRSAPYNWTFLSAPPNAIWLTDDPSFLMTNPAADNFFHGKAANSIGAVPFFNTRLLWDPARTFANLQARVGGTRDLVDFRPQDINLQKEKTYAGYAMLRFGFDVSHLPVDGNLGVRITHTKNEASGSYALNYFNVNAPDYNETLNLNQEINEKNSYTDWQPSLNVRVLLQDDLFLRFAAARALSRPEFADLKALVTLSQDCDRVGQVCLPGTIRYTGSGTNPNLKPQISDQLDAAIEWYPSATSMLYGTVFYKWLDDIIQTSLYEMPFDVPGFDTQTFLVEGPVNYGTGYIRGFEIGGRAFLDFLPSPFSGFGVEANFTYVDSRVPSPFARDENNQPIQTTKEGLSKYSYNLIGFYERDRLSVRVAYNWRSSYLITASGNGTGYLPIYHRPYGQLDASINYDINDHIGVSINAVNLLREVKSQYQVDSTRARMNQLDDRRIGITLRARM